MKKLLILPTLILFFASFVPAQEKTAAPEKTEAPKPAAEEKVKLPAAGEIFSRHIEAAGGRAAFEKIKSRRTHGTVDLPAMGFKGTFEMLAKYPDKSFVSITLDGFGEINESFDGTEAWARNPLQGVRVKTGRELEQVKKTVDFYYDLNLEKNYPAAKVTGIEKIDGAETYVVKADEDTTLYFDKKSGLMTRMDMIVSSPEGRINSVTRFEDFRVIDGVKQAFTFRQSAIGAEFILKVLEIKHNVDIPDERFSKPK
jgi:hypothetical protein